MAKRVTVRLVDDLDNTRAAAETVPFGIDGQQLEIDLSKAHAAEFRAAMRPWIAVARRTGGRRISNPPSPPASAAADIRAWAKDNGHVISQRGRIPRTITTAYEDAHR
ncbi:Lsr2 family protein [Mycolicibacterium sphagni]|uniref:Lsr2 family protein n=1 Tax=Mycolicibacterium sphagni TaxID=1786 RepID=A0ABX2K2Y0_9MYCO|nr:Lsr2 family protein [Mycolicibacterium sphagni]NTY62087.1 Lsr2 family protein [Mycolicibacterium sphagni]